MRQLQGSDGQTYIELEWPLSNAPDMTNLTALRLTQSSARAKSFEPLLRRTPCLASLFYELAPDMVPLNLSHLRTALNHVHKTLTHLAIRLGSFDDEYVTLNSSEEVTGDFGSLRSFSALTELDMSLHVIHAICPVDLNLVDEILPVELQRLVIDLEYSDYFSDWILTVILPLFQDLHKVIVHSIPNLEVALNMWQKSSVSDEDWVCDESIDEVWGGYESMYQVWKKHGTIYQIKEVVVGSRLDSTLA
jgi:hypothetical protein